MCPVFCSFLSQGIISFIEFIIDLLPDVDIPIFEFSELVLQIISYAFYFLPMATIIIIFKLSLFITGIRYTWSIFLRIKSFIPGLGG